MYMGVFAFSTKPVGMSIKHASTCLVAPHFKITPRNRNS